MKVAGKDEWYYSHFAVKSKNYESIVSNDFDETSVTNLRDADGKTTGLSFVYTSDVKYLSATDKNNKTPGTQVNYSQLTEVTCDEDVATPRVDSVDYLYGVYTVKMTHKSGCPTVAIDTEVYLGWLHDNEWAIGIIYIIAGPLIGLFGAAWFPYVVASLVAIFTMGIVLGLSLAFGWMTTTVGTVVTFIVAIIAGVVLGILIRRNIWCMIGLVGMIAGFFSGSLVYALICGMSGWEAVWGFWVISVIMAAVGCVAACYLGKTVVQLSTSLTGAYLFMRSWTLFFPGNYPSEAELVDGKDLDLGGIFWVFIAVWIVGFVLCWVFQCKHNKSHDDLDNYEKA